MRFFVCLLDPSGGGVSDTIRGTYESLPRSRGLAFTWRSFREVPVLIGGQETGGDAYAVEAGTCVAVGNVRLDNRADLARWAECDGRELSDLELVLRTVARHGTKYIPQFLGDFAFVVWNAAARTAIAACDAFAVRKLYYAERQGLVAFASRAEALAPEGRYEPQYLAELVAACVPSAGLSAYADVRAVPAATMVVLKHGGLTTHSYWSAYDFDMQPRWAKVEGEAVEACAHLLTESVRRRLANGTGTWAQLSGGIDSSSIVSVAQSLVRNGTVAHGVAGTVTFVDSHGTGGDEREYSNAVVSRYGLRNETIVDAPVWHDDQYDPPRTDQPAVSFVFYPRDVRLCALVHRAGGRVLLTGTAGDSLFAGNMFFFADWVTSGRVGPAIREMARRAAIGRASFWDLAYLNVVLPLLPQTLRHRLVRDPGYMPPWVAGTAVRQYGLRGRAFAPTSYAGHIGDKYHHAIATELAAIPVSLTDGVLEEHLDVRHPFLYRPLVEFALQLPPEVCVRPYARKWVLREAMRGILPDAVRARVGKGAPYGRLAWSMHAQRALLESLAHEPILAELGIVDAARLRAGIETAQRERDGRAKPSGAVHFTLAIEAWLRMRSGQWPRRGHVPSVESRQLQ